MARVLPQSLVIIIIGYMHLANQIQHVPAAMMGHKILQGQMHQFPFGSGATIFKGFRKQVIIQNNICAHINTPPVVYAIGFCSGGKLQTA